MYKAKYESIVDMKIQNAYLSTEAGRKYAGEDQAKAIIEKNLRNIEEREAHLDFLETYYLNRNDNYDHSRISSDSEDHTEDVTKDGNLEGEKGGETAQ